MDKDHSKAALTSLQLLKRLHCMQGTLSITVGVSAHIATRNWLQSGIVVHLLQHRIPWSASAGTTQEQGATTGSTQAAAQRCVARGHLQANAMLDGTQREWSCKLCLLTEVPLFNAKGVRLGVQSAEASMQEVSSDSRPAIKAAFDLTFDQAARLVPRGASLVPRCKSQGAAWLLWALRLCTYFSIGRLLLQAASAQVQLRLSAATT